MQHQNLPPEIHDQGPIDPHRPEEVIDAGPDYLTTQDVEQAIVLTQLQEPGFGMDIDAKRNRILANAHNDALEAFGVGDDTAEADADRLESLVGRIGTMRDDPNLLNGLGEEGQSLTAQDRLFLKRLMSNIDEASMDPHAARSRYAEMDKFAGEALDRQLAAEAPVAGAEEATETATAEERAKEEMIRKARAQIDDLHVSGERSVPAGTSGPSVERASEATTELQAKAESILAGATTFEELRRMHAEQASLVPAIHAGDENARSRYYELGSQTSAGSFDTKDPKDLDTLMHALGIDKQAIAEINGKIQDDIAKYGPPGKISISFQRTEDGILRPGLFAVMR